MNEKQKASERHSLYIASATAKRFSSTLWFWAPLVTYVIWGAMAVFIGLFMAGVGVVPIAIVATAVKGEWAMTGQIILLLILTFGSRMLGYHFAQRADELVYQ